MSTACCSYSGCFNSSKKIKNLKMFRFPRCPEVCEQWVKNCGNTALTGLSYIKLYKIKRVCQRHFNQDEILPSGKLFKKAVPFPCTVQETEQKTEMETVSVPMDTGPNSSLTLQPIFASLPVTLTRTKPPLRQYGKKSVITKTVACQTSMTFLHSDVSNGPPIMWTEEVPLLPQTAVECQTIHPSSEKVKTVIKEEIEVDVDISAYTGLDDDQYENSFSNEHCGSDSLDLEVNTRAVEENISRLKKSTNTTHFQRLAALLESDDLLKLNIGNVSTADTWKFINIDPKQPRISTVRPSTNEEPTFLECQLLELKLRIHYLKAMIKNEEEVSNLKKEVSQLQIMKEKMEIENNRNVYLQKKENLKLEHAFLKLQLSGTH